MPPRSSRATVAPGGCLPTRGTAGTRREPMTSDEAATAAALPVLRGLAVVTEGSWRALPPPGLTRAGDLRPVLVVAGPFEADPADIDALQREHGVAAVIAHGVPPAVAARALAGGLPVLVVDEARGMRTGDRLRIDLEGHVVINLSAGDRYVIRNLDDAELELLRAAAATAA